MPADRPVILGLYDHTHIMGEPWETAGFEVVYFDIQDSGFDFRLTPFLDRVVLGLWAFPPCDHLAVSGARWWAGKGQEPLLQALSLADAVLRVVALYQPKFWMLENPVGRLARFYGKATYMFDPCDFAGYADDPGSEAYTKRTCLWGQFEVPLLKRVEPALGSKMHLVPPGPEQKNIRSKTPQGFARAFFRANVPAYLQAVA